MQPQYVTVEANGRKRELALRLRDGAAPAVVWLGGFMSDMASSKAEAIDAWGETHNRAVVRFDYSGHGLSSGQFADCTVTDWLADAMAVIERCAGPGAVLVGSSMGGWIALLATLALRRARSPAAPSGLVLIAPAVDFTETLMWQRFPETVRSQILTEGVWMRPSAYGDAPYPITRNLIEDGRRHLLFGTPFALDCPVQIIQGRLDPDVPWQHARTLVEHLPHDDVGLTLVADGEHRLSRPQDIALLLRAIELVSPVK